ncbi:hypothetical protein PanWU01x14_194630 [Parasponia andersonii]|uniref:Transmembrane protein n=1 Tax=Parasponia andersonii TaxID=3476 RepID=A0A2P5C0F0_PARAD|nr:hypothetical protein PanWU01x14_194630 [Parasponia andersonii]
MAGSDRTLRSAFVTLFVFAMVLTPLTSEAARVIYLDTTPICPACVCCTPPPPGSCCTDCCAGESTQSQQGSP